MEIVPNWHPILVHFAITLVVASALLRFVKSKREETQLRIDWAQRLLSAWAIGVLAATVAAGFYAYYTVGHDGPSHAAMTNHRNWALSATTIFAIAYFVQRWAKAGNSLLNRALFATALILIGITGFKGGELVYRYGIGVQSLPQVTSDGHDHDHAEKDDHTAAPEETAAAEPDSHQNHSHEHAAETAAAKPLDLPVGAQPIISVVDAFGAALRAGDSDKIRQLLHSDVLILEGGGVERSLADYAAHHMQADIAFMRGKQVDVVERFADESESTGYVVTRSRMRPAEDGEPIAMSETTILKKEEGQWKIVHIHWSNT